MDGKFCTQCGNPLNEKQRFCPSCGAAVVAAEDRPAAQPIQPVMVMKKKTPGKGLGISSMVLGIIGLYYGISTVLGMPKTISNYKAIQASGWGAEGAFEAMLIVILIYSVLSILALAFGGAAIGKKYKNGISISGVVMGLLGLIAYIVSVGMLLSA